MRVLRFIALSLCLAAITFGVILGFVKADEGSKRIGGYFDENIVFSVQKDAEKIDITILNEKLTLRRL